MESTELRYIELKNQICRQIYEGICLDGEKIPSERQLSEDFNVSRITVRKALELLEEEGLILREVGNGTTVTLKNHGNETAMDVIALAAPSRNPFFARFIAGILCRRDEAIKHIHHNSSLNVGNSHLILLSL